MKTIFKTICMLVFLGIATQGQAQTKEETIKWLKEKLSKYMVATKASNITLQSIDECKMVFNYTYGGGTQYQQILPTAIIGIDSAGQFWYSANVASDQRQGNEATFSSNSYLCLADREENIRQRVEKALKHLATFCPKKQETF